jgi:hypothetical protein
MIDLKSSSRAIKDININIVIYDVNIYILDIILMSLSRLNYEVKYYFIFFPCV